MHREPSWLLPEQWSTSAPEVDRIFNFLCAMSAVLFVGITATVLVFVWRYRRRPGVRAAPTGHNLPLEIAWTLTPVFLLALVFHWGARGYVDLTVAPADALEIRVRARKWAWDFEYPNGDHETNHLVVPVNRPIRLVLSSDDVIHSLFVPAFRIKRDAVPGMYSTMWFQATQLGTVQVYCAEYCGAAELPIRDDHGDETFPGHSSMLANIVVVTEDRYQRHFDRCGCGIHSEFGGRTPVAMGEQIYRSSQCYTCHSVDGSPGTGPTWLHMAAHPVKLTDGTTVDVDANYLRESILNPQAKVVRGFQPVMPTYRGSLNDRQIDALIAYMHSLQ